MCQQPWVLNICINKWWVGIWRVSPSSLTDKTTNNKHLLTTQMPQPCPYLTWRDMYQLCIYCRCHSRSAEGRRWITSATTWNCWPNPVITKGPLEGRYTVYVYYIYSLWWWWPMMASRQKTREELPYPHSALLRWRMDQALVSTLHITTFLIYRRYKSEGDVSANTEQIYNTYFIRVTFLPCWRHRLVGATHRVNECLSHFQPRWK